MIYLANYGLEEYLGLHVVLSNFFWWISVILTIIAYQYRHLWNVGNMPWTFLFLTFICFSIREFGHLSRSVYMSPIRYIFGIWSAIFMASALVYLYVRICSRKKDSKIVTYTPFALAAIFPVILVYLYFSGAGISELKNIMSTIESVVWLITSSIIIYITYMLGMSVTGGFARMLSGNYWDS